MATSKSRNLPAKQVDPLIWIRPTVCGMNDCKTTKGPLNELMWSRTGEIMGFFCDAHTRYLLHLISQGVPVYPGKYRKFEGTQEWKASI